MGQIQVLATEIYAFYLGQDRLMLKDENVFINLKCSFLFDFMSLVWTHDCVFHVEKKTDESQKFYVIIVISRVKMRVLPHFSKSQISSVALFRFVRAFQNCQRLANISKYSPSPKFPIPHFRNS